MGSIFLSEVGKFCQSGVVVVKFEHYLHIDHISIVLFEQEVVCWVKSLCLQSIVQFCSMQ